MTALATIGHNQPPTRLDEATAAVDTIHSEAKVWLDGEEVTSQEYADKLALMLEEIRKAKKLADDNRKADKKPHDDAGKAVQADYKPLIERCDQAAAACKSALAPWLRKIEDERIAAAKAAREEAAEKERESQEAVMKTDHSRLDDMEAREQAIRDAEIARRTAAKIENEKSHAKGGSRAIGLRTVRKAVLTDMKEAARHFWVKHPDEFKQFLQSLADKEVRQKVSEIPGFNIVEERVAQ
jgi:hypothetical protein